MKKVLAVSQPAGENGGPGGHLSGDPRPVGGQRLDRGERDAH